MVEAPDSKCGQCRFESGPRNSDTKRLAHAAGEGLGVMGEVLKTLVIERERWARGEGDGKLLASDGRMCCLGFAAAQCGVGAEFMLDEPAPSDLDEVQQELVRSRLPWLLRGASSFVDADDSVDADALMKANDSPTISDAVRETRIAAIFADHGTTVVFK